MTLQQFLLILYARRRMVLYIFGGVIGLTLVISLLLPKEYTATTSVVVDVKSPDPIAGVILPGLVSPGYMATQIDIIESERVALRVVKLLGFDRSEEAVTKWREATDGEGSIDVFYASSLMKKLDVKPSRESNVISISYSAAEPKFAAALANAFARAYIDTTIDLRVEPARQYALWFDERLKGLRDNLERAQSRLSAYQQDKGIVITDERLDLETARLNELTAQLAQAQGQRLDASSRQKSGSNEYSVDVMQSPLVQNLKTELARAEARLSEVSRNVGKNHPQYQQLEGQIEGIKKQIKDEIVRISGSAASANRFGALKEEELQAAIDEQKRRVFDLRSQRDQLGVMIKDVENAQRAYESVSQRMSQTNLESQSQQTNVMVLSAATEPGQASKPRIMLNLLLSIIVGSLLGVGSALASELLDRRIRDMGDLRALAGMPVLGSIGDVSFPISPQRWIIRQLSRLRRRPGKPIIAGAGQ